MSKETQQSNALLLLYCPWQTSQNWARILQPAIAMRRTYSVHDKH
jgi:hypothetical protein